MKFARATKDQIKLRVALLGPAGSGKTYSMLSLLAGLGQRVAVICTEHNSARKYGDLFAFDVLDLASQPGQFCVENYINAINAAEQAGYDALGIDSLSHAWAGPNGLLEFVDRETQRSTRSNSFGAWRTATPLHNRLIDTMLACKMHLVATMRTKMEYVVEKDDRTGKSVPRKVGMQPVQRDGLEYEFDVVGDLDQSHSLTISKTRCSLIADGFFPKPGAELAQTLLNWANSGAPKSQVAADIDLF